MPLSYCANVRLGGGRIVQSLSAAIPFLRRDEVEADESGMCASVRILLELPKKTAETLDVNGRPY